MYYTVYFIHQDHLLLCDANNIFQWLNGSSERSLLIAIKQ